MTEQFIKTLRNLNETLPEIWTYKGKGIYSKGEEGVTLEDVDMECIRDYLEGICLTRNSLELFLTMIEKLDKTADAQSRKEVGIMARNWLKENTDSEGDLKIYTS